MHSVFIQIWQAECTCVDRIVAARRPLDQPIEQGSLAEVQTAAWFAMRSWKGEVAPAYNKLVSMPDLAIATRIELDEKYSSFLCFVSAALVWCEQYAAAKKLLLEGRAQFANTNSEAREWIERDWRDLVERERKLGRIFDAKTWEDGMPLAVKSQSATQIAADQQSRVPAQQPNVALGLSQVAGMADLKAQLVHEVIGPFRDPELYRRYRVTAR